MSFNPYRVFKFVATLMNSWGSGIYLGVSIPIGFSSSLQQSSMTSRYCLARPGFNPYRVFKFVATLVEISQIPHTSSRFNPYRVFKFVATLPEDQVLVRAVLCFNPYRVFKFVATRLCDI